MGTRVDRPVPLPLTEICQEPGLVCQNIIDYDFCYHCCVACNYDRHTCHFCGDSLSHLGKLLNGLPNPCYKDAVNENL